jgi:hypothetical protein
MSKSNAHKLHFKTHLPPGLLKYIHSTNRHCWIDPVGSLTPGNPPVQLPFMQCPPFWGWHSVSNRKWGFTEAGCSASSHSLKPFSRTPPRLFSSHSWCRQGIRRTDTAELQGGPSKSEWNFGVPPCFGKLISTGFDFDSFKPQICDKKRLEHVGTSFGVLWVMPFWNIRKSGTLWRAFQ